MINAVDLTLGVLIIFFLLRNLGGPVRTAINILCVLLFLIIFGIMVEVVLLFPVPQAIRDGYRDSFMAKTSVVLIKWIYPAVQKSAPQVDKFMREKVLSKSSPETERQIKEQLPTIILPQDALPKLKSIQLPKLGK